MTKHNTFPGEQPEMPVPGKQPEIERPNDPKDRKFPKRISSANRTNYRQALTRLKNRR